MPTRTSGYSYPSFCTQSPWRHFTVSATVMTPMTPVAASGVRRPAGEQQARSDLTTARRQGGEGTAAETVGAELLGTTLEPLAAQV